MGLYYSSVGGLPTDDFTLPDSHLRQLGYLPQGLCRVSMVDLCKRTSRGLTHFQPSFPAEPTVCPAACNCLASLHRPDSMTAGVPPDLCEGVSQLPCLYWASSQCCTWLCGCTS